MTERMGRIMIYVTGDTHGDPARLSAQALRKLKENDTLIICGDFGFLWNGDKKEEKLLRELGSRKYNICFLDGTHENFDLLREAPKEQWKNGTVRVIYGNLRYLLRGEVYHLEGMKIFTMGGGESPDREMRVGTEHWSREEMPSRAELFHGLESIEKAQFDVDLIFTHEPPLKTKEFLSLGTEGETRVSALNSYFDEIGKICKYKKWYFGSTHMDKVISRSRTAVFRDIRNAVTGEKL